MNQILFSPYSLGNIKLKNRIVMAPMTRSRCPDNLPGDIVATYYSQRSEAGLIITEGTAPSANGLGYARIPGIFSKEQMAGWKKVTTSVHKSDSKIFIQLMHTGRVSHELNMPKGAKIVAPSAIAAPGTMWTDEKGMQPFAFPHVLTEEEIKQTIKEYIFASRCAVQSGFDGVELHGANGYLIDQFLNTASNKREDKWGGSIENRIRFALEVARKVSKEIGLGRVGMRISPYGAFNGMTTDPEHEKMYDLLTKELNELGLLYLHIVDHSSMGAPEVKQSVKSIIRNNFKKTIILSGGYDKERAIADLVEKKGELVAFGRPFIANPKLVTKFKEGLALEEADQETFYSPGEKGYTDYL
ncbi:MAG: alkene reductase [Oligoflexia bacterium]|nr:alkene reductase [Oligoflexia bacterium]